jgi:hypothetical protein
LNRSSQAVHRRAESILGPRRERGNQPSSERKAVTAGAFALTLCIGVCPAPAMASAGLVGPPNGRRRRAALLVLTPPDRAVIEVRW